MDFVWHFWICVSVLNTCSWAGLLFPVKRTGCEESSRQLFVCRAILIRHLVNGSSAMNFRRVCLDIITSVWQASNNNNNNNKREREREKKPGKKGSSQSIHSVTFSAYFVVQDCVGISHILILNTI